MPALYIPKPSSFQGLVVQLQALQTLAPEAFTVLKERFEAMNIGEYGEGIVIPMAAFAADESIELKNKQTPDARMQEFQKSIQEAYDRLNKEKPRHLERHQLGKWQQEVKSIEPRSRSALNLLGRTNSIKNLHKLIKEEEEAEFDDEKMSVLESLQLSAQQMHHLLTPSVLIKRDQESKTVSEEKYNLEQFLANPPDIMFIMGNNDLRQVDFVAALYARLKRQSSPKMPATKVYVSGFGGHGTMHDAVFSLSEGETMVKRLLDLGVPQSEIVVEYDAVDTGRNVKYMDIIILLEYTLKRNEELKAKGDLSPEEAAFLQASELTPEKLNFLEEMRHLGTQKRSGDQDHQLENILEPIKKYLLQTNTLIHRNILISGTPGGLLRQTRTFEKQTTLPWGNICSLTPDEFRGSYAENHYYSTQKAALINFIYALREVASFLDYTVNKEFISNRMISDRKTLKDCIDAFINHYNSLAKPNAKPEQIIDPEKFTADFIRFSQYKSEGKTQDPACQALKEKLNRDLLPAAEYFRKAFLDIEHEHLEQIDVSKKMTPNEQAERIDTYGTYARLGLSFSHKFYQQKKNTAAVVEEKEMAKTPTYQLT